MKTIMFTDLDCNTIVLNSNHIMGIKDYVTYRIVTMRGGYEVKIADSMRSIIDKLVY